MLHLPNMLLISTTLLQFMLPKNSGQCRRTIRGCKAIENPDIKKRYDVVGTSRNQKP